MKRRTLLKASLALTSLGLPAMPALARAGIAEGESHTFSFDKLKKRAERLAGQDYESPEEDLPDTLADLEPLDYQRIDYDDDKALWGDQDDPELKVHFMHVGMDFKTPVRMYKVDPDSGKAQSIPFDPDLFDYGDSGVDTDQLEDHDLGFAGWQLWIQPFDADMPEAASFLGASYFRGVDKNRQYGLSARGLAVNTNEEEDEEFPDFTHFWFELPEDGAEQMTVYALLNSPSVTGAYRFNIDTGADQGTTMDISCHLYTRTSIKRLGVGPMTSMFLKGTAQENTRETVNPMMHDSDRLAMWRGNGEWITRPLNNPPTLQFNTYLDDNPRGFGLVQHDHDFEHYRDPVTWYNRRPSLWLTPKNDWGKGHIALMELPTIGETVDNIVAFWTPHEPVDAGQHLHFDYELYWQPQPPVAPSLAIADKTWAGMGNVEEGWINGEEPPEEYARRFAIDFVGENLEAYLEEATDDPEDGKDGGLTFNVTASNGKITYNTVHPMRPINGFRAVFDWVPTRDDTTPVTLRGYLTRDDEALSETWLYQWVPPAPEDRHY